MNSNGYLIPANSKKSQLIFGYFTPFDLALFLTGAAFTTVMLILSKDNTVTGVIIMLLPLLITGFLVMPVPHYHNVITLMNNIIKFYTGRKKYYWKGWCIYESRDTDRK